ncbi:hypothetical protein Gpo141_00011441 [Globisporangium polare]
MASQITEGPVQATNASTRLAPNQTFEKYITFDGKALTAAIELLILSSPGFTHVSYNQSARENVIRVSGDSEEIIDAVSVIPAGPSGWEIRVDERFDKGHLLTEVLLAQPSRLKHAACNGSAVVVLDENVVTKDQSDSDLKISLTGNGDLYLSDDHLNLQSFDFSSTGKGEVQLATPSVVVAGNASIHAVNASRVKIFTSKFEAKNIELSITGSGDFQVAAPSMGRTNNTSSLVAKEKLHVSVTGAGDIDIFYPNVQAGELSASVTGSGDVRISARNDFSVESVKATVADFGGIVIVASRNGSSNSQVIKTAGHGEVDLGDVTTVTSNVDIAGNGSVIVQATGAIRASVAGSGGVRYIGEAPSSIEGSAAKVKSSTRDPANPHSGKMVKEKKPCHVPEKDAAFSEISVKRSNNHIYKVKIRSFAELKDKVGRFFGFGGDSALAVPAGP